MGMSGYEITKLTLPLFKAGLLIRRKK